MSIYRTDQPKCISLPIPTLHLLTSQAVQTQHIQEWTDLPSQSALTPAFSSRLVVTKSFQLLRAKILVRLLMPLFLFRVYFQPGNIPEPQNISRIQPISVFPLQPSCSAVHPNWANAVASFFFSLRLIYVFLATLGLCCCMGFSQVVASGGYSLVGVCGLLTASYCSGFSCYRIWTLEHRLNNCGTRAQLLHGMWDRPRPGVQLSPPALADTLHHCATREALQEPLVDHLGPPLPSAVHYHCSKAAAEFF